MKILKKFFKKQMFHDITGFNCGISLAGPPLMTAWCFLADGILIDTGIRHLREHISDAIEKEHVTGILVTHHHEDHSGNAAILKRKKNVPVTGHSLTAKILKNKFRIKPYQHLIWGKSEPVMIEPFAGVIESESLRFLPIHTPGHSEDHTVYLEETRGMLFSGDLYLGEKIKFFRADENFEDQLRSLEHVLNYDFNMLFCAHNPVMENGKEKLTAKYRFLVEFYGKVKDLRGKGCSTKEIIRKLDRKNDRTVKLITLNNACFANMARSAIKFADKELSI